MQRDCYRCGSPIEEQLAFCSTCGAPQIRVSRAPDPPSHAPDGLGSDLTSSSQPAPLPPFPADLARGAGIEWKYFLRITAPLAAFIGILTIPLTPLGLLVLLPASLIWSISRYRQRYPAPLRRRTRCAHGRSYGTPYLWFLSGCCFLAAISLNPAKYRELVLNVTQEAATRNPDPQVQQTLQWFATPDGLIVFTAIVLVINLVIALVVGIGSGALAVALGKARNRP